MADDLAPPCTRREARREARRDAIIEVATHSFLQQGYAATTMSGIAAILGGSKGTLWNHFPTKEVLFEAVLDRLTEAFRAQLSVILVPTGRIADTLDRFCREYIAKVTSPAAVALQRLVIGEVVRFPEIGVIFYDRAPRPTHQLLGEFLASAMARGQLRQDNPLIAAQQLIGLCLASCQQPLLVGVLPEVSPARIREEAARAVATFVRAMAPDGEAGNRA